MFFVEINVDYFSLNLNWSNGFLELKFLEDQDSSEESGFLAIYGRSRAGKTILLISLMEGKPGSIFSQAMRGRS